MWQGLIILDNDSWEPKKWHGTLLSWAVLAVAIFINTAISGLLPIIEGIILVLYIQGFVAIIVPLVYLSPHASAASVSKTVLDEAGWPTQGLSYCVGFIGNVAIFVGMRKPTMLLVACLLKLKHHRRGCCNACEFFAYNLTPYSLILGPIKYDKGVKICQCTSKVEQCISASCPYTRYKKRGMKDRYPPRRYVCST